ncbi:hypothetical protein [Pseudomonas sp. PB3P13]
MNTTYRFSFPTDAKQAALEMPMDFDLHVNINDWVGFELMPGLTWAVTRKKFMVLGDNTVKYVDYVMEPVEDPELP